MFRKQNRLTPVGQPGKTQDRPANAMVHRTNQSRPFVEVCYVPDGNYFLRTCFEPDETELAIYRKHGKPTDF